MEIGLILSNVSVSLECMISKSKFAPSEKLFNSVSEILPTTFVRFIIYEETNLYLLYV